MPDENEGQPRAGQIVTFYSFKGGTGRTMALANVAWILAANGLRVLVADWDLESPGLHKFFMPFLEAGVAERPGIIDFIRKYEWAADRAGIDQQALEGDDGQAKAEAQEKLAGLIREHVRVQNYAIPLSWPFPEPGELHFLSHGKQRNGDYQTTLSALDWDTFYDNLLGGEFFDALRANMKRHYDYVLIDSRTGLSDVADICTVHLPDVVVDCFTLSTQGIEGAAMIAKMIQGHTEREIKIMPVPMRIDQAEKERADAGQEFAARQFAGLPAGMTEEERRDYWAAVAVPYQAFYAYEETLAVFGDTPGRRDSLLASFEQIATRITKGAVTGLPRIEESLRLRTRLRFIRSRPANAEEVLLEFGPEDELWAEWISAVLAGAGIAVQWANEQDKWTEGASQRPRLVTIVSEFYHSRPPDSPLVGQPDLTISVAETRLTHGFEGVPVLFLAGLSESQAVDRLLGRLAGRRSAATGTVAVRYPGGDRPQISNIPTRNVNFTGRQESLRKLREELRARGVTSVLAHPLSIQGLGGVGKTQLALEYTHRFKADYDVIWWMNCGQSQYVDASLADLGNELRAMFNARLPDEGGVAEVAGQVLRLLSENRENRRWLLVYDNADDIDSVMPLLPSGRGHVLITSRERAWARHTTTTLQMKEFDRPESIGHLRRRLPTITEAQAGQVAEVLGDLPLAVATAGAWLASTLTPVPDYLELLERDPPAALSLGEFAEYPGPVAQAWDLSLERLRQISPAASRLLELFSVMAPDIHLKLIYSQAMATALQALDPTITEPVIIGKLVQDIDRLALIKLDTDAEQIQVHRLVQAVVRGRMAVDDIATARRDVHKVLVEARPAARSMIRIPGWITG